MFVDKLCEADVEEKVGRAEVEECRELQHKFREVLMSYELLHRPDSEAKRVTPRVLVLLSDLAHLRFVHEQFFKGFQMEVAESHW